MVLLTNYRLLGMIVVSNNPIKTIFNQGEDIMAKKRNFCYLLEIDNILLLAFFLSLILFHTCIIVSRTSSTFLAQHSFAISLFIGIAPSIISGIYSLFRWEYKQKHTPSPLFEHSASPKQEHYFSGLLSYQELDELSDEALLHRSDLLNRKRHCKKIIHKIEALFRCPHDGHPNCLYLTGASGSGKSMLLRYLKLDLLQKGYEVEIIHKNYNNLHLHGPSKGFKKKIIVLDQFERALNYHDYIRRIQCFSKTPKSRRTAFIFVFPQQYLSHVSNALNLSYYDIYTLSFDSYDINQLKNKIIDFTGLESSEIQPYLSGDISLEDAQTSPAENNSVQNAKILLYSLKKLADEKIPLVEFEILGRILESDSSGDKNQYINRPHQAVEIHLNQWISKFPNKLPAQSILYLLSKNDYCTINELKWITFEPEVCFRTDGSCSAQGLNIIDALKENMFIQTVSKTGSEEFKIIHDYVAERLHKYCLNHIPDEVKGNVDYFYSCKERKEEGNQKFQKFYEEINAYYKKYTGPRKFEPFCLIVLCVALIVLTLCTANRENVFHWKYIGISLCSVPATYYIYNYCHRFFCLKSSWKYSFTCIGGMAVIFLSYLYVNLWAIFMGLEVIVLGVNIACTFARTTYGTARQKFMGNFEVFCAIGFVVSALGVLFLFLFGLNREEAQDLVVSVLGHWLELSYYLLFFVYALLSVLSHIQYDYIFIHRGYATMLVPLEENFK